MIIRLSMRSPLDGKRRPNAAISPAIEDAGVATYQDGDIAALLPDFLVKAK